MPAVAQTGGSKGKKGPAGSNTPRPARAVGKTRSAPKPVLRSRPKPILKQKRAK